MQVEVDKADPAPGPQVPCDHPDRRRAVATDHNGQPASLHRFDDPDEGVPDVLGRGGEVLRPPVRRIGAPSPGRRVSLVDDLEAVRLQLGLQPRGAHRSGCLLLPGRVRSGAGRDADDFENFETQRAGYLGAGRHRISHGTRSLNLQVRLCVSCLN